MATYLRSDSTDTPDFFIAAVVSPSNGVNIFCGSSQFPSGTTGIKLKFPGQSFGEETVFGLGDVGDSGFGSPLVITAVNASEESLGTYSIAVS